MPERLHIVLSKEEKERYRALAERDGATLSAWIREAVRERAERYDAELRVRTPEDLDAFFADLDRRHERKEGEPEPDWEEQERLIDEGRRSGTTAP